MEVTLLIAMQVKHFLLDFTPLQNRWMATGKFKNWPDYFLPLASHAIMQGIGSFLIAIFLKPHFAIYWFFVDTVSHFFIDRLKADKRLLNRWKPQDWKFWMALGLDQLLHNLVYIFLIFYK